MIDQSDRRLTAYGLVIENGSVLLTRPAAAGSGVSRWTLPGGHLAWGEAPAETLQREITAQTGLGVGDPEPIDLDAEVTVDPDGRRVHDLLLVYRVTIAGDPRSEDAGTGPGAAWHPLAALPSVTAVVRRALEHRSVQSRR